MAKVTDLDSHIGRRLRLRDLHVFFTVVQAGSMAKAASQLRVTQPAVSQVIAALEHAIGVPLLDRGPQGVEPTVYGHSLLKPVPGRMERLNEPGKPLVAVDYAHTPDALEKGLQALRPLAQQRGGKLWCVFGCGGDRDPTKRPVMAAVAEKNADRVVVTSDNPRSEKPEHIISQILLGLSHAEVVEVEADRARAIAQTVANAAPQDVILLAGKGHEDYQEIAGVKHVFSDQAHAAKALENRK